MSITRSKVVESSSSQQNVTPISAFQLVCCLGLLAGFSGKLSVFDSLSSFTYPSYEPPVINFSLPNWLSCVLGALIVVLSLWEALRFPRLASQATTVESVRTALQILGDLLLAPWRAVAAGETPALGYQCTPTNLKILSRCPTLLSFKQTPWLHNALLAFAVLIGGDMLSDRFRKNVRRELLEAPDGGIIALDWWEHEQHPPEDADKVLFIGSTFTGDSLVTVTRGICDHFTSRGWRCVVMVKRGCGLTLNNVQPCMGRSDLEPSAPWCLSGLSDIELAIDHVALSCPGLPVCGLGLSTGAGQLRNYVNSFGSDSKLAAAVLVDAAPSWGPALESLDRRCPLVAAALASAGKAACLASGMPKELPPVDDESVEKGKEPLQGGMVEFVRDYLASGHGFGRCMPEALKYMEACQPADTSGCAVPVLEMFTFNDSLMTVDMCQSMQGWWEASPHVITATTRQGTHMIRWEGLLRPKCWLRVASAEFLEAALQFSGEPPPRAAEEAEGGSDQCGSRAQ